MGLRIKSDPLRTVTFSPLQPCKPIRPREQIKYVVGETDATVCVCVCEE